MSLEGALLPDGVSSFQLLPGLSPRPPAVQTSGSLVSGTSQHVLGAMLRMPTLLHPSAENGTSLPGVPCKLRSPQGSGFVTLDHQRAGCQRLFFKSWRSQNNWKVGTEEGRDTGPAATHTCSDDLCGGSGPVLNMHVPLVSLLFEHRQSCPPGRAPGSVK